MGDYRESQIDKLDGEDIKIQITSGNTCTKHLNISVEELAAIKAILGGKIRPTIKEVEMFHTPTNMEALENWITKHSGEEAIHILTGAMMAWNLAAKTTNMVITEGEGK